MFGEKHSKTADSYSKVGLAQHALEEYTSALESETNRVKTFFSVCKSPSRVVFQYI